jgi:hypothetical protein
MLLSLESFHFIVAAFRFPPFSYAMLSLKAEEGFAAIGHDAE